MGLFKFERLHNQNADSFQIKKKNIYELSEMSLGKLKAHFDSLKLSKSELILSDTILKEIKTCLHGEQMPAAGAECDYCAYRHATYEFEPSK